jgi:hypothetical protein
MRAIFLSGLLLAASLPLSGCLAAAAAGLAVDAAMLPVKAVGEVAEAIVDDDERERTPEEHKRAQRD